MLRRRCTEHDRQQREIVEQRLQKGQLHFQAVFLGVRRVRLTRHRRLASSVGAAFAIDRERTQRRLERVGARDALCHADRRDDSGR